MVKKRFHVVGSFQQYCPSLPKVPTWICRIISQRKLMHNRGPFYKHGLTFIPARISNYIHYKVQEEITYPFPNFNVAVVEIWGWIKHVISYFYWTCDCLSILVLKSPHASHQINTIYIILPDFPTCPYWIRIVIWKASCRLTEKGK